MSSPNAGCDRTEAWQVDASESDLRLDVLVASHLEDTSRAQVKRWIEAGRVLVEGETSRPSRLCRTGESIEVAIPAPVPAEPEPEDIPLSVLDEDEHIIVIDKPAGMVVHPSAGHSSGTLVNALLWHCRDLSGVGGVERPGIVHRLDAGTSGVILVAKNDRAHRRLAEQFQERVVDKHYLALVRGSPPERLAIDRAIGRDRRDRKKMSSRSDRAKPATSTAVLLERLPGSSLLDIQILTGRTHQIRVHLSEAGFPIVGDREYGSPPKRATGESVAVFRLLKSFPRPALHAASLALKHPETGMKTTWQAPLPKDMQELLSKLRELKADWMLGAGS